MNFLITSKPLLYLCHVNLMAGELTNLESCYVACHHHVVVRTTFNNDLRLIGGRTGFFSGLIVHSIFQLPPICCDLKRNNDTKQSPTLYLYWIFEHYFWDSLWIPCRFVLHACKTTDLYAIYECIMNGRCDMSFAIIFGKTWCLLASITIHTLSCKYQSKIQDDTNNKKNPIVIFPTIEPLNCSGSFQ